VAEYTTPGQPLRQSLLRTHDACPLSAKFSVETGDHQGPDAALGSAMHLVAEEILRTLHRVGERQMPTQEAMEIAYEVLARPECPHLSATQMETVRMLTLMLAAYQWSAERIVAIEQRLFADVPCPDGQSRGLTGSPDILVADPPAGCVIVDLKFGRSQPPKPRDGDWERDKGRPYLSERGAFQLDCYGLLVMRNYPAIEKCILRERHIRIDELREATLEREELEHVERRLGIHLQRLEEVLTGEREPEARPGSHCHHCPRPHDCPVDERDRGEGAISTDQEAVRRAEKWAVADSTRALDGRALKGWLEKNGSPGIELSEGFVGWKTYGSGKRSFGLHSGHPT
jgi:RecB family exonuclease